MFGSNYKTRVCINGKLICQVMKYKYQSASQKRIELIAHKLKMGKCVYNVKFAIFFARVLI